ncbi:MAG: NUDIX hydrolase [Legionella sp.]|jgi:ADP-ribose pyrophosphatase YjhB (NUDIX family)
MDKLIAIANSLFAIAQNGLLFTKDVFDKERYHQIQTIAAEILANKSELTAEKILDLYNLEQGYATPKIDIRGACFKNDQILMVKERTDGLWSLPGGWVDINESPSQAICKEIYEESGFEARAIKLMGVYDINKHQHPSQLPHIYKLFFICEITGGSMKPSIETSEIDFFDQDKIPDLSLRRVVRSQIDRAYEHKNNMSLPADFD